jgi:hypothetical protein
MTVCLWNCLNGEVFNNTARNFCFVKKWNEKAHGLIDELTMFEICIGFFHRKDAKAQRDTASL